MFLDAGFYCTVKERITFLINFINEISVCFTNTLYVIADIAFLVDTFRETAFGRASSIIGFGGIWSRPTLTFKKICTTALLKQLLVQYLIIEEP